MIQQPENTGIPDKLNNLEDKKSRPIIATVTLKDEPESEQLVKNSIESLGSLDEWDPDPSSPQSSLTVLIDDDNVEGTTENQPKHKRKFCVCLHKAFCNVLVPGIFGINSCRYVEKISPTSIIAKELMSNIVYYNSKIKNFFAMNILPEIQYLASILYFPTGQVEADGLSAISAEIWSASYLLLSVHKEIREADFYDIRSAFTSLVWDSSQNYRQTQKFFKTLQLFKQKIVPVWLDIEAVVGVTVVSEYIDQDSNPSIPSGNCGKCKSNRKEKKLSSVKTKDGMALENRLVLQINPEKHCKGKEEKSFNDLDYGGKIDIIKQILKKPELTLQTGVTVFLRTEPKLLQENIDLNTGDEGSDLKDEELLDTGLTCSKAMKILRATLMMFYEEVQMTDTMLFDVTEKIRNLSNDIYAFLEYSEWICNKFSEFHSMLRLCYNFALLCYDLDLPAFDAVVQKEMKSEQKPSKIVLGPSSSKIISNDNALPFGDNVIEYKVVSLTDLMLQASNTLVTTGRQPVIDEDFEWQNFYKTEYHGVLQRLPIRVGSNLLQFSVETEVVALVSRQRGTIASMQYEQTEIQTEMEKMKLFRSSALQYA